MKRFLSAALFSLLFFAPDVGFASKRLSNRGFAYLPVYSIGSTSSVVYTGAAGATFSMIAPLGDTNALVRIFTTSSAYIATGASPTATVASGMYIPANTEMILEIPSGHKVSAIQGSGAGTLFATHLSINRDD